MLAASGCRVSRRTPDHPDLSVKKPEKLPFDRVNLGPAQGERFAPPPAHQRLWRAKWEKGTLDTSDPTALAGDFESITGALCEKGKETTDFRADHAHAERESGVLVLRGSVRATSRTRRISITCDRLEWTPKTERIRAVGHVGVQGSVGTLGTLDELLATPSLELIATPALFKP